MGNVAQATSLRSRNSRPAGTSCLSGLFADDDRFFILQAHYRGTLDFSNEALQAAEKGYERLMKAVATLPKLKPSAVSTGRRVKTSTGAAWLRWTTI